MSEDVRAVTLDAEQYALIEEIGFEKMRAGEHEIATKLLAIALSWRIAPQAFRPREFHCDVDESGGLADVVHLHSWSARCS